METYLRRSACGIICLLPQAATENKMERFSTLLLVCIMSTVFFEIALSARDNPERHIRQANDTTATNSTAANGTSVGNITISTGTTLAPYRNSGDSPTPYNMLPLLLFASLQMWISSN